MSHLGGKRDKCFGHYPATVPTQHPVSARSQQQASRLKHLHHSVPRSPGPLGNRTLSGQWPSPTHCGMDLTIHRPHDTPPHSRVPVSQGIPSRRLCQSQCHGTSLGSPRWKAWVPGVLQTPQSPLGHHLEWAQGQTETAQASTPEFRA